MDEVLQKDRHFYQAIEDIRLAKVYEAYLDPEINLPPPFRTYYELLTTEITALACGIVLHAPESIFEFTLQRKRDNPERYGVKQ